MKEYVLYANKASNPPNVSQARPNENFLGCLAQKVDEGRLEENTTEKLLIFFALNPN